MNKMKSRKLWAWIIWGVIFGAVLFVAPKHIPLVIPWYGGVTMIFIGGQAAIDLAGKLKGKNNE